MRVRVRSLKEVFCLLAAQRLFFEDYRVIYRGLSLFVFSFVCFLFPQGTPTRGAFLGVSITRREFRK